MTILGDRRRQALADPTPEANLQYLKATYELGFSRVSKMEKPSSVPPTFKPYSPAKAIENFEHREVLGTGSTWQQALDDWHSHLKRGPQSGKELIWRVPPEIDCFCDFSTDQLIWKVYSRMIIIPQESNATQVIVDDPQKPEPEPEPWGSPFAMNTENWK